MLFRSTEFKQNKSKKGKKFIKDKAIVNFLLAHMRPVKIDFSKIKIPSYMNLSENEEKNSITSNPLQAKEKADESFNLEESLLNSILERRK